MPSRGLVAKLTRIERVGPPPYGRVSYEFDGIDVRTKARDVRRYLSSPDIVDPFAAIRIVTTPRRFEQLAGFAGIEGAWYELKVRPRHSCRGPIALHSQLTTTGYTRQSRGVLKAMRFLARPGEEPKPLMPLSSAVASEAETISEVISACNFPSEYVVDAAEIMPVLAPLGAVDQVVVRDVGQASFVTFLSKSGKQLGHFDAGWPVSFNGRTAPKSLPTVDAGIVILSHWDWDHLHAYHSVLALKKLTWITPVQGLGPGAHKVATQLGESGRLMGYQGSTIYGAFGALTRCGGTGQNHSGLALILNSTSGAKALFVGDANYETVGPSLASARYDLIVATHHGALFAGQPVTPATQGAPCIISVGKNNVYKHPRADAVDRHVAAGWSICSTSDFDGTARGDRAIIL